MLVKLVRDKIPQIVKNATFKKAEKHEYKRLLLGKLQEEVSEFILDQNEEEIADILEVIEAIIKEYNFSSKTIDEIKKQKKLEKGDFGNMILGFFDK